ncbi:hypothetical protein [Leisingera sp. ANG-M1]|nr:hypothetical protein [Leisingera sp. ANG-M1]
MDFKKTFLIVVLAGSTAIALMSQAWAVNHADPGQEAEEPAKSL